MSFVTSIKQRLTADPQVDDLLEGENLSEFGFIGIKETTINLDIFAFVAADGLLKQEVSDICDKFFNITRACHTVFSLKKSFLSSGFGLGNGPRMPNGILCFVFEKNCPRSLSTFIREQTKIKHTGQAGVIVPWSVDVANKRVYTHKNPVSIFPPVVIFDQFSFPNPDYIESFLSSYRTQNIQSDRDKAFMNALRDLESNIEELNERLSSGRLSSKERDDLINRKISVSISAQNVSVHTQTVGGLSMTNTGDIYNAEQVGAMGKYARADHNTFIKSEQKQSLADVAAEIQQLLTQLETTNPSANEVEKINYVSDETSPSFKRRAVGALKAGGEAAIEEFLDNSYINVAKAIIKEWMQPG